MKSLADVFKAYDIRGTVPDQLNADQCRAIGAAMARFAQAPRILLARDMRESGVELSHAFAQGARAEGVAVVDLGMASTDLLYFAAGRLDAPGAMFTASHNPAQYNGIKLCLSGARPIGMDTGLAEIEATAQALLDQWGSAGPPTVDTGSLAPMEEQNLLDEYADHVRSFVDLDALRPLKVVADTANGMGGLVAPKVFEPLPFNVEILFPELDGNFPNHPADPIQPENLTALKAAIVSAGADVGLAFDGDADRVFLVDEHAEPVSGSLTTALVAASMLDKNPGSTVLYNCICSRVVPEVIAEHGGIGVRTRVGHSYIKAVMAETGAVFGGEHSGHYYFRDNYRADSGIIAAMVILELLSVTGKPLSELLAPYKRYSDSGEINTEVPDPAGAVEKMAAAVEAAHGELGTADRLDGLTVDRGDWWYNLRPSNTEPLLRLNVEAPTDQECQNHVDEILADVSRITGA
ncbi:MAG TPA: phosphomannomutase/phosphoglucomutase [Acidimicrobiales bacterium]|jgi:phosphomannomutase|nr:phosphomannomutase/phosphoglucomutase [Acidimicrobiales bacterium]